jgi:hypothetical protein
MTETEISYQYEATCEICGDTKLTTTDSDFTMSMEVKERYGHPYPEHECEYSDITELEEPIVRLVEY